jgi:hypothetical protein
MSFADVVKCVPACRRFLTKGTDMMKKLLIAAAVFAALSVLINIYTGYTKPPEQRAAELQQAHDQIFKKQR